MQSAIVTLNRRRLAQGAAVLLVAGLSAGCSSDLMRFDAGLRTSSTASQPVYNQQQTASVYQDYQNPQPYPGEYPSAQPDGLDQTTTASVNRGAVQRPGLLRNAVRRDRQAPVPSVEVGGSNAAPRQPFPQQQAATQPFPTQPRQTSGGQVTRQPLTAPAPDNIDRTVTGSIQKQAPVAAQPSSGQAGWNANGGTQITVREGETVHNLSRRFGVPAEAILRANGLKDATALRAGRTITIPAYVYSANGQTSSAGANPKVAAAPSDKLPSKVPTPDKAPTDRVAVLPEPARVPERNSGQTNAGNTARTATTGAVYTVVAGDTLSGIAGKTGSSTSAIKQANGLDSGLIRIGQKLVIPGATVQASAPAAVPEGVDPIVTGGVTKPAGGYTAPKNENAEIAKMVEQAAAAPDATGVGRLRWPVHGRIVSDFGSQSNGKRNDGVDIAVPEGTPVKAAENGVVIYAGDGLKDFGNTVLVRHENGLVTVYGHNSEITVSRGATVRRGQELARSGLSGNAGSPKLHFEVRKDSAPVDPAKYLE
jgi:murein DD-endopeptidase MepM/ murein hydrolase activator NlpD